MDPCEKKDQDSLEHQYEKLQHSYEDVLEEHNALLSSKTWRIANMMKNAANKVGIISVIKFALAVSRFGIKEAMRERAVQGKSLTNTMNQSSVDSDPTINKEYLDQFIRTVGTKHYKAVIVAQQARDAETLRHQKRVLSAMAQLGYLCFINCEENLENLCNWEQGVLFVYKQKYLQSFCSQLHVITIINELKDIDFVKQFASKVVWLDVFSDALDNDIDKIYEQITSVPIVTYINSATKSKLNSRSSSIQVSSIFSAQDCEELQNILCNSFETCWVFANSFSHGCIAVLTVTFFDFQGNNYYSGGAERYLLDLNDLCQNLGIRLRVFQYADDAWLRFYNNLEVVGIPTSGENPRYFGKNLQKSMFKEFVAQFGNTSALNIYSPFYLAFSSSLAPSIGISHGISWDDETNNHDALSFWQYNCDRIKSVKYCDQIVSVDTNTPNWFQTIRYADSAKIRYIPNYVDTAEFTPRTDYLYPSSKVIITYPRRLYKARGLYLLLDIIDTLMIQYKNIEIHFVGKGFKEDTQAIDDKILKWGSCIKRYFRSPDEMHEVYKQSDICLIPTIYSEGTSLSCLEALSSGNAVIATRVGGLPDLIIDGYNGMMIEPTAQSLLDAITKVLDNPEMMVALKTHAVETAKAFSKNIWKERWTEIIKSQIKADSFYQPAFYQKKCIIQLLNTDINDSSLKKVIVDTLWQGYVVFIATQKNPYRRFSFERLQFIDLCEELYCEADMVLSDKNSTLSDYYVKLSHGREH
ncbi:MAG: glycosyltransferase family 4 protein [Angelakisella sp.]|nr:glycosyltransferase family 4 protein [Angelakisella sp.]